MSNPFDSVKDSSIWYNRKSLGAINHLDGLLYVGIVRSVFNDKNTNELRYIVEVKRRSDTMLANCRMVRSLGGVYNYTDHVLHGYNYNAATQGQNGVVARAGDIVLVGQFAGQGREGVILGGLTHPARTNFLKASDGPQYRSEINGIETFINKDGEYTLTFKGQPTNLASLEDAPNKPVPAPQYDTKIGSSYLRFDKTGGFTISDNAQSDAQSFQIDKANGILALTSGKVSLKLTKQSEEVALVTKSFKVDASSSVAVRTKTFEMTADDHSKWTSPEITIDTSSMIVGDSGTNVNVSAGTMGAARVGDLCGFALIAGPYTVTGTIWINQGSKKVKIG
jgi:hypothetical protein